MPSNDNRVWVLLDDRAGNRAQAEGVAKHLRVPFRAVEVRYGPLGALPNALLGGSLAGLTEASKELLTPPWPDLVIAAGRRTAPAARWIKRASGGRARLVQIMDPGAGRDDFNLICRPAHDGGGGAPNVLTIDAAPHRLSAETLADAAAQWTERVSAYPAPRIALLIGGSTRRRAFTDDMAATLCRQASAAAGALGGSILATTSRRTGTAVETVARELGDDAFVYRWDRPGENPYLGLLALADAVVVTGESVSMCSEACSTGKPVYVFAPVGLIGEKHARLHARLLDGGYARRFEGVVDLNWTPPTLDVAAAITNEIRARGLYRED